MPRSALLPLTLALVLVVGGCDRETASPAQPQENSESAKETGELTGKVDRSHAGAALPKVTVNKPDGTTLDLAALSGTPVLLNLWATWCAPCRAEMPALDTLEKEMGGKRFEVVAVNVDTGDDAKPKKFLSEIGVETLGFYRDATMGLFNDLKQRGLALGLPVTLLIDGEGCLLAHMNGPAEWASPDARKLIAAALDG